MGGAISGVTRVEPFVSYHHQPTLEKAREAIEKGDAEGFLNLNPSTDFKYTDEEFDRSLGGDKYGGVGAEGEISWIRGGLLTTEDASSN